MRKLALILLLLLAACTHSRPPVQGPAGPGTVPHDDLCLTPPDRTGACVLREQSVVI